MSTYSRGHNAARIGVLGLIATSAFLGLFLYVTNRGLSLRRYDIFVRVSSASGLQKGDPVVYRGVRVGEVRQLKFSPSGSVLVRAKLLERVPLTTDAHAELVAVDLFGRQSLVFRDGTRFAPTLVANDTIEAVPPTNVTTKMADLGDRAQRVLSDTVINLFRQTLEGSAMATRQLASMSARMEKLIGAQQSNVTTMTGEMAGLAHNLREATAPEEFNAARANLARMSARMDSSTIVLAALLDGLDEGKGSAGKLLRDDGLYVRTESLLTSLEELVRDVKTNPKRYINVKVF